MYSHMMVGSNDIARSKTFYDALFGATGGNPAFVDPKGRLVYFHKDNIFIVTKPIDGAPATQANGLTIGFAMESTDQADAWHDAGVAAGGTSVEDPPGWRNNEVGELYLAYLRDPDGHKLCALYREPVAH
ncbi:MAG: hypothetical protein H6R45_748 [Proteobacteria bacterium]|nr:hypothetical protein [Pseudomonadota bacterium]